MKIKIFTACLCGTAFLTGCSQQTINSAQNDANHDAVVVSQTANQAAAAAKPQLDKLGLQTRVTTALAAANLPTTIHVRADSNSVYLRGNVKNFQDRKRAGQIAQDTLGTGKKVINQLQVRP